MARLARLSFPGLPHHVIQRGHNGQPIFQAPADYRTLLALMGELAPRHAVELHAYVLMPNHFHLLATPRSDEGLAPMMQAIGRRYVRYFNDTYGRTGTLWDGRYRCTVLQPESYLLACMVHGDLHPVQAGLVEEPADYVWSSHGHYIGRRVDPLVTPHALFWGLDNTPFAREMAYAEQVAAGLGASQRSALSEGTMKGWVLGDAGFVHALQKTRHAG